MGKKRKPMNVNRNRGAKTAATKPASAVPITQGPQGHPYKYRTPRHGMGFPRIDNPVHGPVRPLSPGGGAAGFPKHIPAPRSPLPPPSTPKLFAGHGKKIAAAVAIGALGYGMISNKTGKAVDKQTGLPRGMYNY